jgi:NAD(P)-dependent dehydrogenase (short-subunit alcohol dehydrogenase family)
VALVTGAAGDIGSAIAEQLIAHGARVALLDQDGAAVARRHGHLEGALALPGCDISNEAAVEGAVSDTVGRFGTLSILVNNAATVTPKCPVAELPAADWRRALDVNLTGAWLLARACWPHMSRAGGGVVLNIASQLGHVASPGGGAYSVTKAGLIALARAIAVDGAALNIRGLSLSPGAVMTGRLTNRYGSPEAVNERLAPKYLAGEIGSPEDVAEAACFLLSGGRFLNGCDLLLDGGYTAV